MSTKFVNLNSTDFVSVVIPTLGGDSLIRAIESINKGTLIPKEIIVSLPSKKHVEETNINYQNTVLVNANVFGQVKQRAYGLKLAKYMYVLQLDDGVVLEKNCLENLVLKMDKKNLSAVSPYYMNMERNSAHAQKKNGISWKFYYWLMNGNEGYKIGGVAKSGINFGVNKVDLKSNDSTVEVEWVPGGCILQKKENLIHLNHFPFSGKAYAEDLIYCFLLRSSGIRLYVSIDALCYIDKDNGIDSLFQDFRARYYFVKIASLSITRLFIFYLLFTPKYIMKRLLDK